MSNPFINDDSPETESQELPLLIEYAWDFLHDCFVYENGKHKTVVGNEALKVWIYKTLKTERWRYRAYSDAFGVELEQFIGKRANNETTAAEIRHYVSEGLAVNPYITKINSIDVSSQADDTLVFNINLDSVYGNLRQTVATD